MRTRDAVLLYQETEKDTATKTLDLNLKEPISALNFEVQCTNGATSNKGNYISDIVTKVEIVDGSLVLGSLNMAQLEALHLITAGQMPALFPSEWGGGGQRHNANLFFGRYLWDRDFNFDATKYKNPQLKVTFNKAAIRAAGDTGFASGDNIKLTVVAKVFDDVPAASQFLMSKQIDSFTSVGSGDKKIELPTDFKYRMLLLRMWLQGYDINEIISKVKLTCDTDKFIPIERYTQQLDAEALPYTYGRLKHDMFFGSGDSIRLLFNKEPFCHVYAQTPGTPRMFNLTAQWSSELSEVEVYAHDGTLDTEDRKVTAIEEGHALHATLPIPFGRLSEPEDWFDPTPYERLDLILSQGTASATVEIVGQQVKPQ